LITPKQSIANQAGGNSGFFCGLWLRAGIVAIRNWMLHQTYIKKYFENIVEFSIYFIKFAM